MVNTINAIVLPYVGYCLLKQISCLHLGCPHGHGVGDRNGQQHDAPRHIRRQDSMSRHPYSFSRSPSEPRDSPPPRVSTDPPAPVRRWAWRKGNRSLSAPPHPGSGASGRATLRGDAPLLRKPITPSPNLMALLVPLPQVLNDLVGVVFMRHSMHSHTLVRKRYCETGFAEPRALLLPLSPCRAASLILPS